MKIILLIAIIMCSFSEALRQITGIPLAHIVLTLVQFFGFGIRWDYLNGIFGTGMGGNAEFSTNGLFDSEFYFTNIRSWYWDFVLSMVYVEGESG